MNVNEISVYGRPLNSNTQHDFLSYLHIYSLKFTAGTSGFEVFVSCDMFYVEVLLDPDGRVRDVKVELAGDQNAHEGLVSVSRTVMFHASC